MKGHDETRPENGLAVGFFECNFSDFLVAQWGHAATHGCKPAWLLGFRVVWCFASFLLVFGSPFRFSFALSPLIF